MTVMRAEVLSLSLTLRTSSLGGPQVSAVGPTLELRSGPRSTSESPPDRTLPWTKAVKPFENGVGLLVSSTFRSRPDRGPWSTLDRWNLKRDRIKRVQIVKKNFAVLLSY